MEAVLDGLESVRCHRTGDERREPQLCPLSFAEKKIKPFMRVDGCPSRPHGNDTYRPRWPGDWARWVTTFQGSDAVNGTAETSGVGKNTLECVVGKTCVFTKLGI